MFNNLMIIFVLSFAINSIAEEKKSAYENAIEETYKEIDETYKDENQKQKAKKFITEFFNKSKAYNKKAIKLSNERARYDISLVWSQRNFDDKKYFENTIQDHNNLKNNISESKKILIEANKVMNEKIDSYPFNDPMKMNMKEGFSEVELDTNSSAMRLMNEFEKIIEINQEVIKLIEKNNGKMIKKEENYHFKSEKDTVLYNKLIEKWNKSKANLVKIYDEKRSTAP